MDVVILREYDFLLSRRAPPPRAVRAYLVLVLPIVRLQFLSAPFRRFVFGQVAPSSSGYSGWATAAISFAFSIPRGDGPVVLSFALTKNYDYCCYFRIWLGEVSLVFYVW